MPSDSGGKNEKPLPKHEQKIVEQRLPLRSPMVYEVVRQEGEAELDRPLLSLWWSGIAAGIAMFTSVLAEGVLRQRLPDASWRPLVENFGYCFGFVITVLGRLQLFTESTITAVLPLLSQWSGARVVDTMRLWSVVLLANFTGTFITAALVTWTGLVPVQHLAGMLQVAHEFAANTPLQGLLFGIPAGFLVAAMVWLLPSAEGSKFSIVVWLAYLLALGDFTHVVVGSAEVALLLFAGSMTPAAAFALLLPTLAGNIIGGTGLFALLAYGQVKDEM
ncbi:MAG: formate/nitrite transporter family protein [Steroidobacteraceae bacterium]|nr:formate/nitrite transporter family protein [Steroidobacteraceae bacterium]